MKRALARAEDALAACFLAGIALLPVIELVSRPLSGGGIAGSIDYVRHFTLWVGFAGAMIAARQGRHLTLAFASLVRDSWRGPLALAAGSAAAAVSAVLAAVSVQMVRADVGTAVRLGGVVPLWVAELAIPAGFAVIALRAAWATPPGWRGRAVALGVTLLAALCAALPEAARAHAVLPGLALVLLAAFAGAPIFAVLGGAAAVLFFADGSPLAAIPVEAYRIAANPVLPTIPLFTLVGTVLAEGQASARLMRLFRALFGWMPGGVAVAAIVACAFFTTFNGGSGVTILAMGGLMLPVLTGLGFGERFSLGTLTAAGSLGILFPPSLLIILYGVSAHVAIDEVFLAAVVPGAVLLGIVCLYAMARGRGIPQARAPFDPREAATAFWQAKWEVALPLIVLGGIFSGRATLVEAASVAALFVLATEFAVHRTLRLRRDFMRIMVECAVLVGGILVILAAAMGLTNYLIYADIPTRGADWVQSVVHSRWVFLLALNAFLLVVGCLMDIFSAIVVVVPLIVPVAESFGVDPRHLAVIFLANMELGYLTPPVGMNLFLSAFRFGKPLWEVFRATVPFFLILLAGVLIVTYVPAFTVGVVGLLGK